MNAIRPLEPRFARLGVHTLQNLLTRLVARM